jgi:hypothetical protein
VKVVDNKAHKRLWRRGAGGLSEALHTSGGARVQRIGGGLSVRFVDGGFAGLHHGMHG